MNKTFLFIILILGTHHCFGQDSLKSFQTELNNLQKIESQIADSLSSIRLQIGQVREKIAEIEFDRIKKDETILKLKSDTDLLASDQILSDKLVQIPEGKEVILLTPPTNHFINVSYRGQKGFIPKWAFENEEMLEELIENQRLIEKNNSQIQERIIDSLLTEVEKDKRWIETFVGNLREAPNTSSDVIMQLEQGDEVFVQEQNGDWLNIKYIFDKDLRRNIDNEKDINSIYRDAWVHESICNTPQ